MGFQKSVLRDNEIDAGFYYFFLNKQSYKENTAGVLSNRIDLYYLHFPQFVFQILLLLQKEKKGILLEVKYPFIIIRLKM